MKRLALLAALALTLVSGAAAAGSFEVRLVSETTSTVTLGWDQQAGDGYRFYANDVAVSRTFDPARTSARFAKADSYRVEVLHVSSGDSGVYPAPIEPTPSGEFPNASNTGVPEGVTLTPYSGPSNVTTPNTVIDGKTIGCIQVSAPGVVIRNSKITCRNDVAVYVDDRSSSSTLLTIEDSEIDCGNSNGTGLGEADITARRLDIHGCENGLDINQNIVIEDSYIHDLYNGNDAHADGIQLSFGHWNGSSYPCCARDVTIRHNTILSVDSSGALGTSSIISNHGGDENILIEKNLMAGGAFTLYCEQGATGTNYRVLDNHFSTRFSPKVGAYGPSTDCSDEQQSGNVIDETGAALRLG